MRSRLNVLSAIASCLLLSIISGCSGGGNSVSITQSGASTSINSGSGAVTLTATVSHGTSADVTWTFTGTGCGTFVSNGNSATYTPPAENVLNANCTATITATSVSNTSESKTIVFTVKAVALTLPSGESLTHTVAAGGAPITLTVGIANDASGAATVNWVLSGTTPAVAHTAAIQPAIVPTCGGLSATSGSSVVFTPPALGSCTATITASTSINPNVKQTFTITVTSQISVSITQSGSSTTVLSGSAAVTLTANVTGTPNTSVTWTFNGPGCGTFVSNGNSATYTPPAENVLNANCTATITAASVASPSVTSQIAFTVDAVTLTLPSGESLTQTVTAGGAGIPLTVVIANDASEEGVSWNISGAAAAAKAVNPAMAQIAQSLRSGMFRNAARKPATAVTCGSLSATTGTSVTFTPPAVGPCTATVTASVSANPNLTKVFTITVNAASVPTYTVGGAVTGLSSGASVVLLDNGVDPVTVSSNTTFTFSTALASGANYLVTVGTQPGGENCTITNGGPSAITANVTNVTVTCAPVVATASLVAEHELAQTGLAIALASNVLQSQLEVIFYSTNQSLACTPSSDGTYSFATGATPTVTVPGTPPTPIYPLTVYYGPSCAKPYIVADVTAADASTDTVQETATYYGIDGVTKLGTLTISETISVSGSSTNESFSANGLGTFMPESGAVPVQLGLYCTINLNVTTAQCGGGVAQNFPALNGGLAIGAVTPLALVLPSGSSGAVTFTGGGTAYTGPINSLTLTNPQPGQLAIAEGTGATEYSTTTASGGAASFTLFPPTPTSWTLTDATHDEKIDVSVVPVTFDTTIVVTQISTGNTLATATVDQSGTSTGSGDMTYSDGSTAAITGWTLAD